MQIFVETKKYDAPLNPKEASKEARALLSRMLADAGLPEDLPVREDENGRPYIAPEPDAPRVDFNLSHAGRYVVCALAVAEHADESPRVGVDVEIPHPRVNKESLARRFFSEREIRQLEQTAYADSEFLRIWTRKESYLKFVGTGLSGGMKAADTTDPDALGVAFSEYPIADDDSAVLTLCRALS